MWSVTDVGTGAAVTRLQDAVRRLAGQTRGRARTGRSHGDADDVTGTVSTAPGGFEIRYLDCADLILMRRAAGRPKDFRRAGELEQLTRSDF
jgi:hypothetical protein